MLSTVSKANNYLRMSYMVYQCVSHGENWVIRKNVPTHLFKYE